MRYTDILIILAMICNSLALFLLNEGFAWVDTGYGLHPIASGVAATVLMLTPSFVARRVEKEHDDD